jgi:hypothetical protein
MAQYYGRPQWRIFVADRSALELYWYLLLLDGSDTNNIRANTQNSHLLILFNLKEMSVYAAFRLFIALESSAFFVSHLPVRNSVITRIHFGPVAVAKERLVSRGIT